jgi:hypothetical protein
MSETRSSREMTKQRISQMVQRRLIIWITALVIAILVLLFRVGEDLWAIWIVEYRTRIAALLILITIGSILLSPLIIEYSKHPRALSGPGKNPYIDP